MKILFLTRYSSRLSSVQFGLPGLIVSVVSALALVAGVSSWVGFQFGYDQQAQGLSAEAMQSIFAQERRELNDLQARTQEHLDALALRMGSMQAHVLRLDALGERLTQLGKLDNGEFNFDEEPPMGGRDAAAELATDQGQTAPDLLKDLESMAYLIEDRERKLSVLEELIMNRKLQREVYPAGRPVKSGWISSYYGRRTDPFTGKKALHKGIDFAGRKGSDVIAVAAGVVTRVGSQSGYGEMVEIHHGSGYATRYAHNTKVLVKEGERVTQGQTIAKMGSSGRSTGPHVHFEVLRNGRAVDPARYVRASR